MRTDVATRSVIARLSDILTIEELAAELKVSERTIQRWMADGVITPDVNEGKCLRFSLKRVLAALRKRAAANTGRKSSHNPDMVPTL